MKQQLDLNIFHIDNKSYKNRFIKIVTKEFLSTVLSGMYYSREDIINLEKQPQPVVPSPISCVVFIPERIILNQLNSKNSHFSRLLAELKEKFEPNTFFFNPLVNLHFTLAAQNISINKIDEVFSTLSKIPSFEIEIKGLSLSEYINGRLFLGVNFPTQESVSIYTQLLDSLAIYESKHYITPHCGFVNLLRNISEQEKEIFRSIIVAYEDVVFFKFHVEIIDIIEPDNSLVINPKFLKRIKLTKLI